MHDYNTVRIIEALEHARDTEELAITKINEEPTAPHEQPVIAVTTTNAAGKIAETRITLELDGRGIWMVEGATAEIRNAIHEIAEMVIG